MTVQGRSRRAGFAAALAVQAAVSLACVCGGGKKDESETALEPPIPSLVAPDTSVQLKPGQTTSLTWRVVWPDPGGRPEDVLLRVVGERGYDRLGASWSSEFFHGEEYTLTFTAGATSTSQFSSSYEFSPTAYVGSAEVPVEGTLTIEVAGALAEAIFPPIDRVDLGVGEVRPFTAYAAGAFDPYSGERPWSDEPLGFESGDPGVARVSPEGVITAVAPGSTDLRITAGEAEVVLPLTVTDTPLGPPPPGASPAFAHGVELHQAYPPGQTVGPLETQAALDARGWPMLAVATTPGRGSALSAFEADPGAVVLARWTGTGFGYETLPVAGRYQFPVLTTADDGHVYLSLHEARTGRLVLWDRPGDVLTGGWQVRELPGGGLADPAGGVPEEMEWAPAAVLRREAGGVWLAHAGLPWVGDCRLYAQLYAITPEAIEPHPVSSCDGRFDDVGSPVRLALLPSDVGSPFPTVVLLGWLGFPDLTEWRESGGQWQGQQYPIGSSWGDLAPLIPVDGPEDLATFEDGGVSHVGWQGAREGEFRVVPALPEEPLAHQPWADGDPLRDEPVSWQDYVGHATDRQVLYLFAAGGTDSTVRLHTERLPWLAAAGDPEREGARLPPDPLGFGAEAAHVLPDGTRLVRDSLSVKESARSGAAWVDTLPGASRVGEAFSWVDGGALRVVSDSPGDPGTPQEGLWSELQWDGLDWSVVRSFPVGGPIEAASADPGGGAWLLRADGGGVRLPADPAAPILTVPGGALRPSGSPLAGIAPRPEGGVTLVVSEPSRFLVTSLAADGSPLRPQAAVKNPSTLGHRLIRTATGRLLLPRDPDWQDPSTQGLWASDDDGITWRWRSLGDAQWSSGMALVRLPDDRLVLLGTRARGWSGHQAALVTSEDDGETWSAPAWIRPEGSSLQQVGAVAVDASGQLLVFLAEGTSGLVPTAADLEAFQGSAEVVVQVRP